MRIGIIFCKSSQFYNKNDVLGNTFLSFLNVGYIHKKTWSIFNLVEREAEHFSLGKKNNNYQGKNYTKCTILPQLVNVLIVSADGRFLVTEEINKRRLVFVFYIAFS